MHNSSQHRVCTQSSACKITHTLPCSSTCLECSVFVTVGYTNTCIRWQPSSDRYEWSCLKDNTNKRQSRTELSAHRYAQNRQHGESHSRCHVVTESPNIYRHRKINAAGVTNNNERMLQQSVTECCSSAYGHCSKEKHRC